ncbi:MAG: DUF3919 family protein [Candidatus Pristimantibacillus lignocellulolyticus]|uniref:DUF3919 family protein n=1 Tax=Candidatus Pristimantibacillus lignocellulolyticus TaxID=2994561 RepID=A0A9J6ZGY6_9BACL|nr:MAG: DUF3919 family protein [Candidatus Pristimantibacillus lignocellulolyticus]
MPGDKKGLSWFRLIALQLLIGCMLIGICAYAFRIPVEEVRIVSIGQSSLDQMSGMPMRVEITYPGLGQITIDDPKELLKLKLTFHELLYSGTKERVTKRSSFALSGVMHYLDQDPLLFQIEANTFRFSDDYVSSLNVSATIRKLQSMLIDKILTENMIGDAVNDSTNDVFSLVSGQLTMLTLKERQELSDYIHLAARVIDFSPITNLDHQPVDHFVIQLNENEDSYKHWIHIDRYSSEYFVVYDLLDETNHRAYFKVDSSNLNEGG